MALCFKRKVGQSFWINHSLKIVIHEVKGKWVSLRFEGSHELNIERTERIQNALGVLQCRHAKQICPDCLAEVLEEIQETLGKNKDLPGEIQIEAKVDCEE